MFAQSGTVLGMPRKPLPEVEKKVGLAARVYPSLLKELEEMGEADDRTISYMVDKAIRYYLEHHRAKPVKHKRTPSA